MERYRQYFLHMLPILLGLISVLSIVGVPNPALEPDDIRYFSQLRELRSDPLTYWRNALVITNSWEDQWWVEPGKVSYFRPIPILTYLIDILLFGESPRALLITNICFYLIFCFAVTLLLSSLTSNRIAVLVGTIWFTTLPIHHEGVAYIAGRTDVLAWIFGVLMIRAHVINRQGAEKILFFLMALLCKEYCLLLPFICFFFHQEASSPARGGKYREFYFYGAISVVYVVARFFILAGGSIEGTPLPIYFPAGTLAEGFNQLRLQLLSFVSVSIVGICGPMYATTAPRDLVVAAALSLPVFGMVLFLGQRSRMWPACVLFLIISLVATAPLYISFRYFIGPSVAFACCISLCYERLVYVWQRVALLICFLPIAVFHAEILSLGMRNQVDHKAAFVTPVSEVLGAFEQRKEEFKNCNRFLVVNAPRGQVFQMFLNDFLKISLGRFDVQTVILSHQHTKRAVTAQEEGILELHPAHLVLTYPHLLVSQESSDLSHMQPGAPITVVVDDTVYIKVNADWKVLNANWRTAPGSQVCVLNFNYQPTTSLNVMVPSSLPGEVFPEAQTGPL